MKAIRDRINSAAKQNIQHKFRAIEQRKVIEEMLDMDQKSFMEVYEALGGLVSQLGQALSGHDETLTGGKLLTQMEEGLVNKDNNLLLLSQNEDVFFGDLSEVKALINSLSPENIDNFRIALDERDSQNRP